MITDHESAAIAQTVFYVPALPIALYLCIRNWASGPRMAFYPLAMFSTSTDAPPTLSLSNFLTSTCKYDSLVASLSSFNPTMSTT
jgi:hypothetical protein